MNVIKTNTKNFRKDISKMESPIIVLGGDEKLNRLVVETKKIDILLSPEKNEKKDKMKFRTSGLNQVLCKLAKKNKVAIGFDFCEVLKSKGKKRSQILGKMMQNVKLCKKYKNEIKLGCFTNNEIEKRNNSVLIAFGVILGLNIKVSKESIYKDF